jgi:acyl-CoA thioesterase-1
MKPALTILTSLLLAPLAALLAADVPAKTKTAVPPEFVGITDDPKLPRVLLMGDSVSIAYALEVRKLLAGVANVHRVPANCGSTKVALGSYGLVRWLPDPQEKWDVIHFNHGLHDLSYRFADDRDKNDKGEYASPANGGHQNVPPAEYEKNLHQIIARLKQTGARLIFASTTPVPESDAAKYVKDSELPYNDIAKKVMAEHGVAWNDLWSLVKPRQAELQIPRNVHFQAKGSSVMAAQVAAVTRDALSKPRSTSPESKR